MQTLVSTDEGLLPRSELTLVQTTVENDTTVEISIKWFRGEKMVRADAWVNFKVHPTATIGAVTGAIG